MVSSETLPTTSDITLMVCLMVFPFCINNSSKVNLKETVLRPFNLVKTPTLLEKAPIYWVKTPIYLLKSLGKDNY
jgi:hypothetical protein